MQFLTKPSSTSLASHGAVGVGVVDDSVAVRNYPTKGSHTYAEQLRTADYREPVLHSCADTTGSWEKCSELGSQIFAQVSRTTPTTHPYEFREERGARALDPRFESRGANIRGEGPLGLLGEGNPNDSLAGDFSNASAAVPPVVTGENPCPQYRIPGTDSYVQTHPSHVYVQGDTSSTDAKLCMLAWHEGPRDCVPTTCAVSAAAQGQMGTGINPPHLVVTDWACREAMGQVGDFHAGLYDTRVGCLNTNIAGRGMDDAKPASAGLVATGLGMQIKDSQQPRPGTVKNTYPVNLF